MMTGFIMAFAVIHIVFHARMPWIHRTEHNVAIGQHHKTGANVSVVRCSVMMFFGLLTMPLLISMDRCLGDES